MRSAATLLTKGRELIQDWIGVVNGKMDKLEFLQKWASNGTNFLEDFKKVRAEEMSLRSLGRSGAEKLSGRIT